MTIQSVRAKVHGTEEREKGSTLGNKANDLNFSFSLDEALTNSHGG